MALRNGFQFVLERIDTQNEKKSRPKNSDGQHAAARMKKANKIAAKCEAC